MQNSKKKLDELLKYAVQLYQNQLEDSQARAQDLANIDWYDLYLESTKKKRDKPQSLTRKEADELMASLLIEVTKPYKL